ncbi:cache domain-containing protein [Niveibacterium microcysteis]|uniref:Oxygen sensor histidine kinase NreB n=1 Tax=Niveibacterium microcysteis TaxID=2811415 RepID=A0ABX7M8A3_9RHOO|nr:cache domain-containing protein [Niveibacterium microcysteis]QSI77801.1 cache domain-containing protein [Niveibacterium microcysteis]
MQLRLKVLILAVAPLLLAIAAVAAVVRIESRALAEAELAAVEPVLVAARKAELQHYVELALGALTHLHNQGDDAAARTAALATLAKLDYGRDGYFFVYDMGGRNLMHPRQPELVGQDLWNLRDPQGTPTIQRLVAQAKAGGGFVEFMWQRPSTGRLERKLGYVALEPKWGWMVGTGIYLDDLAEARARIDREASRAINATLGVIAGIAVIAALLVAVGGLALNLSDQRDAEARMRALAHQVVRSQETERARVARELHDGVSQWLVSVKYMFESVQVRLEALKHDDLAPVAESLARGITRLNEVLREIRRISHGLRPALLDDLGLAPALSQIVNEFGSRTQITAQCDADRDIALPEAVATALFRVVQEALANIERHAGAHTVRVALSSADGGVRLRVSDDGKGFDLDEVHEHPRGGLGLSSMRERVETLGGRFDLRSGPEGTTIEALLPESALRP